MIDIKICGLTSLEHAQTAAHAGATLLGFVFAESRRRTTPQQVAPLARALRADEQSRAVRLVGLFVNEQTATINAIADACLLDYIQLSGDETPADAAQVARPIIKSLRLDGRTGEDDWLALARRSTTSGAPAFAPWCFVVDAHVPGHYGGTGHRANWMRAAELARDTPLLLAGGLNPDNVAQAIAQVRPRGVDVSSGVERTGTKNVHLITAFIRAVQSAA